jgi:hypothetical protein
MVVYKLSLISSKVKRTSAEMLMKWSQPVVIAKFLALNVVQLANPLTGVLVRKAMLVKLRNSMTELYLFG